MSQSTDELLDLLEDNLDYEIDEDEEDALLDDSNDNTAANTTEDKAEKNEDVLEIEAELDDDNTELNDEDSTLEQESNRQDRFTSERPTQQCDEPLAKKVFINKPQQRPNNQSFRGRRPQRLSRPNIHSRQQPNKRILINPHFKGNVAIRNNVSLVWDKNYTNIKKPAMHVQPWAHQTTPVFQTQTIYENPYQRQTQQIPQRLGKIFAQPILNLQQNPNQQFQTHLYPAQAYAQPQQYPNYAMIDNYQPPLHIYNTPPPPIVNQAVSYGNSPMFTRPALPPPQAPGHSTPQTANYAMPRYEPPIHLRKVSAETVSRRNANAVNMGPQARRKFQQQGTRDCRNIRVIPSYRQEVPTSDPIIDQKPAIDTHITIKVEKDVLEEDDQMKEYQRLIEQQRQIRESILARKEARRRQMAAKHTGSESSSDQELVPPPTQLVPKMVTKTIVNEKAKTASEEVVDKQAISSFLANRTIFAKEESLPDTSVVVVSNLATGSSEVRLRKLCKGVGDVMNLQLAPKERQATIQFKSVASAHAFFKKYQRSMLDLSVIDVTLKK